MTHFSRGHTLDCLECFLHAGLAVSAHHAFNVQCLDHCTMLLFKCEIVQLNGPDSFIALRTADIEEIQPQSVGNHAETRQTHGRGAEHGIHLPSQKGNPRAGRQRNADNVVEKGPEQIFMNVAQSCPAQAHGCWNVAEPAVHKNHIGSVNGNVCSGADGNADVSASQCGRVIDAVAHHGCAAFLLKLADHRLLAVRQNAGHDLIDAGLGADGLCGAFIIAGQHYHADAHVLQFFHSLRAVFLYSVGHSDNADKLSAAHKQQRRFALLCQFVGLLLHRIGH